MRSSPVPNKPLNAHDFVSGLTAFGGADDAYTPNPISLTDFKRTMYRGYLHGKHLEALDTLLTQVALYVETGGKEGIRQAAIEMPPRHGKTATTSRLFVDWFLGRNPDKRIMLVSYGASLAEKNSRAARNLMATPRYQTVFPIRPARGSSSVQEWDIDGFEGGTSALGIGGAATGKGANLLILDDVVKNRQEAESKLIRDRAWDSYNDDLYTRLEPNGAVIVLMTRWHQDDLIGRLIRNEGDDWVRLRLPAIAESNDQIGRKEGEALWPERYPLKELLNIKAKRGAYTWSSLYQQNPTPAEGGIFKRKWFNIVDQPPPIVAKVRYWDLAMSSKTSADYTVGVLLGQGQDGHYYILDVSRFQKEWGDVVPEMARVIVSDGASVIQGVEEKGFMSRAIQELNSDGRLHGHTILGFPVDTDKLTRALPLAAKLASGNVHVVRGHFTDFFIEELCGFPNGAHDDQVDAASGAWAMIESATLTMLGAMNYG